MNSPDTPHASADERVYSAIYDAVQAQRLAPGLKLKEVDLTDLFKVSRTSVRSALLRLAHKGLVELTPNRGAVIARLSAADCRELFEARRAVEGTIVEVLARAAQPDIVTALRGHAAAQREAFEAGDTQQGHRLAMGFHRLLAQLSGNRLLAGFLDDLLSRMPLVILTFGPHQPPADAAHADHSALVEAIAAGRADEARRILEAHLQHVEFELNAQQPHADKTLAELLGVSRAAE